MTFSMTCDLSVFEPLHLYFKAIVIKCNAYNSYMCVDDNKSDDAGTVIVELSMTSCFLKTQHESPLQILLLKNTFKIHAIHVTLSEAKVHVAFLRNHSS